MTYLDNPAVWLLLWLLLMSLVLFLLMGRDKRLARRGQWRIPEARLFLFALLGGALGGWLGLFAFRHKTKHLYFALGFPLIALLQWSAAFWLLLRG